jgi:hypothetical protein
LLACGRLALDWPCAGSNASWERVFPDGTLKVAARYDETSRLQTLLPEFHHADGRVIILHDPYSLPDHRGVRRHTYAPDETLSLLREAGYRAWPVPHYRTEVYHMLLAAPPDDAPT